MTNRNSPCPCGSGKKHKKCCLPLVQAFKVNSIRKTGESHLVNIITVISNNTLKTIRDNEDSGTSQEHQLLVDMTSVLWNISFLPAKRSKQITESINDQNYKSEVSSLISKMRHYSTCTKLMIVTSTSGEIKDGIYPVKLETHKVDIDYLNENIEEMLLDINEAVDFMVENTLHKESKSKIVAEVA